MKKTLSRLLAAVLCLSVLITAASCSSETKHPLKAFYDKMEKAENYQLVMTMIDVPFLGTYTVTGKFDGNIEYTAATLFTEEEYIEKDGDVEYKYTKDDSGKWTKTKVEKTEESEEDMLDEEFSKQLFNPENYEEVEGEKNTYKQKSDVKFDECENVKIKVEDESCTIEMSVTSEGMTLNVKLVISEIGKIELKLPEVE